MGALHTQPEGEGKAEAPHALLKRTQAPSDQCLKWKCSQDLAAWVLTFLHGCLPNLFVISLSHLSLLACTAASPSVPRRALMPDFMRALVTGCNSDINTLSAIKPLLASPSGNCLVLLYEHSFVLTFNSCLAKALFR